MNSTVFMESPAPPPLCEYLALPPITSETFRSHFANLLLADEHIRQLTGMRRALVQHSLLHNSCSSTYTPYTGTVSTILLHATGVPRVSPPLCGYLTPPVTASDDTSEYTYLNRKIGLLDDHILQLMELQRYLLRQSGRLKNSRSRVYTLPTELLSDIFNYTVGSQSPADPFFSCFDWETVRASLRRSFALSAVTRRFRQVALSTADLWKMVPLVLTTESLDKAVALLHHCFALAPRVNIFLRDTLDQHDVSMAIDLLFPSDVAPKVKYLDLKCSNAPEIWIENFGLPLFPTLDSLCMTLDLSESETEDEERLTFDLKRLSSLVHLRINSHYLGLPVVIPPAIQSLHLINVLDEVQISLLYQCPNVVECFTDYDDDFDWDIEYADFPEPLTLPRLKRLVWAPDVGLYNKECVQKLHMPSLEQLELKLFNADFETVCSLCCNHSPTLKALVLSTITDAYETADLRQFFKIPFPKLETLQLRLSCSELLIERFFLAFATGDGDSDAFPDLRKLVILSDWRHLVSPVLLLFVLSKWRVGNTSRLCIEVRIENEKSVFRPDIQKRWSPHLLNSLKSTIGDRPIEVIWGGRSLLQSQV